MRWKSNKISCRVSQPTIVLNTSSTLELPDATSPTVTITAPSPGATITGATQINATAEDSVGVTQVVFSIDGNNVSTDTSAPYSYNWDGNIAAGLHTIRATAHDAAGNTSYHEISITRADTTSPSVTITAPTTGTTQNGVVNITATASDNVAVSQVVFSVDGSTIATDTTAPYSTSYDFTSSSVGSHTIRATASDAAGNTSYHEVTITRADTTAPSVTITAPSNGTTQNGSVNITATASDNVGVSQVVFSVDGSTIATDTTAPYSATHDFTGSSVGNHTIRATAHDAAGNTAYHEITVTRADTTAPSVSVTSPTNGTTVSGTINITATASDNVAVSYVEFYRGATLIGTDNSSPYSVSWNTELISDGAYTITAKAFDVAGNNTTSSGINVTVDNGSIPSLSSAIAAAPFAITLPTVPTTSTTASVANLSQMTAAIASAKKITVTANITGDFGINGITDLEIDGGGFKIGDNINLFTNCKRIKIHNGSCGGITAYPQSNSSQMLEDFHAKDLVMSGNTSSGYAFEIRGRRFLIESCDAGISPVSALTAYGIWLDGNPADSQDVVIYNCNMRTNGTESTVRLVDFQRSMVLYSTLENPRKHCYRLHGTSTYAYAKSINCVNRAIMINSMVGDTLDYLWIDGAIITMADNGLEGEDASAQIESTTTHVSVTNCQQYTNNYNSFPDLANTATAQGWTWTNNISGPLP